LDGKTPLEAAKTENLDALAARGVQGLLTVIDDETCPETDSGTMALLGYDPLRYYTGRGALEALGLGFMEPGDNAVGFRINFASHNAARGELDRRTARDLSAEEQQQLVTEIREGVSLAEFPEVSFSVVGFGRHRGIVCFKSSTVPLSAAVSNTDPGFRKVGPFGVPNENHEPRPQECRPMDATEAAATTARLVNLFVAESAAVLDRSGVNAARRAAGSLPANILLFRDGGGQVPSLEPFSERCGLSLSFYGSVPAEHGLCKLIGGVWREFQPDPGESVEHYYGRLVAAARRDPSDVVVVHIKAADEPGHDGLPHDKVRAIEEFDRVFLRQLLDGGGDEDVYVVTSDHATPCELRIHSADRVPTLVSARKLRPDSTRSFGEREAAAGGLAVGRASELLPYLVPLLAGA
jgi:2,3-bisphosphoglycerate-independent phosphoglycerate mutase